MTEEINRLKNLFESYLAASLPGEDASESRTLFEAIRYSLDSPGKRVRPVLLLLACKAVGGSEVEALPFACSIELIHNYSLIHDDLPAIDNDDMRRGKLTNHKVFGEAMAILAGDGLLSAAFEMIHLDYIAHLDDSEALKRRIRAGTAIAHGCGTVGMVAGQAADIESEGNDTSADLLEYIHMNKTAALIRAAVSAGAYIGGGSDQAVLALTEYGEKLGLIFQITDDILDYGSEDGKATYPAIHGLGNSCLRLEELTEQAIRAVKYAEKTDAHYIKLLSEMAETLARRVE